MNFSATEIFPYEVKDFFKELFNPECSKILKLKFLFSKELFDELAMQLQTCFAWA